MTALVTPSAPPWALPGDGVARSAGTDPLVRLSERDVVARLDAIGPNEVATRRATPVPRLVLAQLTDAMILVLQASAALTAAVGDLADTLVILAVVAVNTTLGVVQEFRAGRAISTLGTLTAPAAHVVRDGAARPVPARDVPSPPELVPTPRTVRQAAPSTRATCGNPAAWQSRSPPGLR